ncbi:hypothetical protein NEUTE1DRAFT_113454 [Neurospora tetrasperma FGSC 2508]|uniref:Uncharacterized protein n=1 Tax=Neurospora tetrasperma (strain FGSC 2508 / ATCC MYA-4615 / P0657) TaxID=510951 RepID=F8MYH6_NEUT8|nr:uncharacterized protein NEUTE1DRAFT_113454 [Neurospora tetrasperma FGSC 2508]EGO51373.1 hypothetical protein NEUTE1DRAFT_113454 [Neurospora tetrasperma FGSC 2508]EGZ78658.1 hypothetical protein NEUTE2DRAFT_163256 [Neurospora tetrasperma FGSC 2509]
MKSYLLSLFSLLGLSTMASALAVLPPTARYEQASLQATNHNVHASHEVNTASGFKTFSDEHTSALTVIRTVVVTTVQATKHFRGTFYNLIAATHPERHPHFIRRAKRDLNHQEDSKLGLSEAVEKTRRTVVDIEKAISGFVEGLGKGKTAPENGDGHAKRDLNDMDETWMSWTKMTGDPKWMEANDKVREAY